MMERITITVEERNALYEYLLSHLTGLDDLREAFEQEEFDRASRLSIEFGDELRLMEDLGWGHTNVDGPIEVTMPPGQRSRLFLWLRAGIESLRRDEEREEAEIENEAHSKRERVVQIAGACDRVLEGASSGD
jgi:hypothetical protein